MLKFYAKLVIGLVKYIKINSSTSGKKFFAKAPALKTERFE